MALADAIQGPSLPPRVHSNLIGSLTICLQECTVDAFARIQFWGDRAFKDFHPIPGESVPISAAPRRSAAVEYPLVGSVLALSKYLEDASPLHVIFLRHAKCRQESRPEKYVHSNHIGGEAYEQVEVVGHASILDLGIAELLKLDIAQDNTHQQVHQLPLRRRLKVVRPDQGVKQSNVQIGEALFELLFKVTATLPEASRPQDGSIMRNGVIKESLSIGPVTEQYNEAELSMIQESRPRISRQPPSFCRNESKCSLNCDLEMRSDFSIDTYEQTSLLEELLDLCTDDMTLPTIDSTNSASVDPTDMWISRLLASACSPDAKEFPSLASAGSSRSSALRKVGLLKLEVDEVTLISSFADKIKGKHDFFLQYDLPPRKSEHVQPDRFDPASGGLSPDSEEFVVCKQFGKKARPMRSRAKSIAQEKLKEKFNQTANQSDETPLLTSAHSNTMEVEFNDDDFVRQWLDCTMKFRLFYCLSKSTVDSKLPRVAKLASKKREFDMASNKICLAEASLRLRSVIRSEALENTAKLDLLLSVRNKLLKDVREGTKVGLVSVKLGLHSKGKIADHSIQHIPPSSHATVGETQPPPTLTPHPISVFLSSCIGDPGNDKNVDCQEKHSCTQIPKVDESHSDTLVREREQCARDERKTNVPLKPVQPPPIWLYIRVYCISNLRMGALISKSGSLQMRMSCSEPFFPLKRFTHHECDKNEAKMLSLESRLICSQKKLRLRTGGSNAISSSAICSWQVALDAAHKEEKSTTVTFHIWHCANAGDSPNETGKIMVGLVKIPLLLGLGSNSSQQTNKNWLPNIATNGRFDVLHPESRSPIGQVQALVAAGMLCQIRGFPEVCSSASRIQSWWRRNRSASLKKDIMSSIHPKGKNDSKIKPHQLEKEVYYADFVVAPAKLQAQHEKFDTKEKDDLVLSPDSLFEEWSQQSAQLNNTMQQKHKITEDKDDRMNNQESPLVVSELGNGFTEDVINEAVPGIEENVIEEPKSANSSESNEFQSEAEVFANPNSKVFDRIDIRISVGTIRGLQELLTAWCGQGDISLLPASGVFISCSVSQNNETTSQQKELHQFCLGDNICHSKVISTEKLTRDLLLSFESTLSMPNHEKNTEMILSQALVFKLWFVPIITATIAGMIGSKRMMDVQSLKDCSVIPIATCPLYHLYTLKGCYEGRVPFSLSCFSQKSDVDYRGYITASISRIDKVNDVQSSLSSKDEYPAMSSLKPLNLEVSFSRELGSCVRQGIDPPEEKFEQPSNKAPGSSKRKVDQSSVYFTEPIWEQRELKRHRVAGDGVTSTEIHVESNGRKSEEEPETLWPSDTSENYEHEQDSDSDSDETMNYRSLTSVMESLENINSKLKQASAFSDNEGDAALCIHCENISEEDTNGKDQSQPHLAAELNFPAQKSDAAECGRHRTDPPEEKDCSEACKDSKMRSFDTGKTCERGSSPIHTACQQVNATTNTCEEYPSTRVNHQDGSLQSKESGNNSRACQPKDVDECPDCDAAESEPSFQEKMKQHEEQKAEEGPQETPADRIRNHLATRGHLEELSKASRFLNPVPSYSWRAQSASVLSPLLNCMSPTRFDSFSREAVSQRDKRVYSNHFSAVDQVKPHSFGQNLRSMSEDKDRLERIFRSRP